MSAPNLAFSVEPWESGKVNYLPIAPEIAGRNSSIKLILALTITNKEAASVHVSGITFSFPGSANQPVVMQVSGFDIAAGQSQSWADGHFDGNTNNEVFLPVPALPKVMVSVTCRNFASPATVTYDLTPFKSNANPAGVLFPFHQSDMRFGEYASTNSLHSSDGPDFTQINAHDIGVVGFDPSTQMWSATLPGTDRSKNEHY
jgi:hypothetical protein